MEEVIQWHKYPDEKPPKPKNEAEIKYYMVTANNKGFTNDFVFWDMWLGEKWESDYLEIIAWAECPHGWK